MSVEREILAAIERVKTLARLAPLVTTAWREHRARHPERRSVTGSWRRMKNSAEATYLRLANERKRT